MYEITHATVWRVVACVDPCEASRFATDRVSGIVEADSSSAKRPHPTTKERELVSEKLRSSRAVKGLRKEERDRSPAASDRRREREKIETEHFQTVVGTGRIEVGRAVNRNAS